MLNFSEILEEEIRVPVLYFNKLNFINIGYLQGYTSFGSESGVKVAKSILIKKLNYWIF